jgi:hypothetical protein
MFQCTINRIINGNVEEVFNEFLIQDKVFDSQTVGLDTILFDIAKFDFKKQTLVVEYKPTEDKVNNKRTKFPEWTGLKENDENVVIKVYKKGQDTIKVSDYEQVHCKIDAKTSLSFAIYEHVEERQIIPDDEVKPNDPVKPNEPEMVPMSSDDEAEPNHIPHPNIRLAMMKAAASEAARKLAQEQKAKEAAEEEARKLAQEQKAKEAAEEEARKLAQEQKAKDAAEEEAKKAAEEEEARKLAEEEAKKAAEAKKVLVENETKMVEQFEKDIDSAIDKIMSCVNFIDNLSDKVSKDWEDKKVTHAHVWVSHTDKNNKYKHHKKGLMMDIAIMNDANNTPLPLYGMYVQVAQKHNERPDVKKKIIKNKKPVKDASVPQTAQRATAGKSPRKALGGKIAMATLKRKRSGESHKSSDKKKKPRNDDTDLVLSGRKEAPPDLKMLMKVASGNNQSSESEEADDM